MLMFRIWVSMGVVMWASMRLSLVMLGAYHDHCSRMISTMSFFILSHSRSLKKRYGAVNCSTRIVCFPSGALVLSQMLSGATMQTSFSGMPLTKISA